MENTTEKPKRTRTPKAVVANAQLQIRLTEDLKEKIFTAAEKQGQKASQFVLEAVKKAL